MKVLNSYKISHIILWRKGMRGRDMQEVYEVFENFSKIVGNVSKRAYRNCAVLMTGAAVVALISFNSKEFVGCGKNRTELMEKKNLRIVIKDEDSSETKRVLQTGEFVSVSTKNGKSFVKEPKEVRYRKQNGIQKTTPETPRHLVEGVQMQSEGVVIDATIALEGAVKEKNNNEKAVKIKVEENQFTERKKIEKKVSQKQNKKTDEKQSVEEVTSSESVLSNPGQQREVVTKEQDEEQNKKQVKKENPLSERVVSLDERNYQVLLRIVEAEAGGEGLDGKKLVANVILNRVNHNKFPDTVEAVVFEKSGGHVQFSPTADGRFETVVVSEETIQAVEAVLCGEDNSQGALFFSARSKADPDNMSWFDQNLKWLFAHGGHEFYTLP